MGFFGGYENAGVGIAKNEPQKKPFFRHFEIVFRKFWKLIELNLLFMCCLLPLVAVLPVIIYLNEDYMDLCMLLSGVLCLGFVLIFGPWVAGVTKILRNFTLEKPTFLWNSFWKTFRSCFKQSCLLGILDLLVLGSSVASFYVYPKLIEESGSNVYYVMFIFSMSIMIAVIMMNFYAFLMIVSTDLSFKNILKNSLALSCIALKQNIITLLIVLFVVAFFAVLTYCMPYVMVIVLCFCPLSFLGFTVVFNSYPQIQKYVINPYYASRGEVNPEYKANQNLGQNVFEDQGGKEAPIVAKKKRGKGKKIS